MVEDKTSPNPTFASWEEVDHKAIIILQASPTEYIMDEILSLCTARYVWVTPKAAYCHVFVEPMQNLKDSLHQVQEGSSSVSNYG